MKTANYIKPGFKPVKWLASGLICVGLVASAVPLFPLPYFPVHPPGFVVHLPSPGPGLLPPGGGLPPLFFFDGLPSPDLHHWEVELHNPTPVASVFNVSFSFPGGGAGGAVSLPSGSSMYFDIMYGDVAEVGGPYMVTALSSAGMPGPVLIDTHVLEYPGPVGAFPGIGATLPAGAPGAIFGPMMPGLPGISLTIAVPEPSAAMLLGLGTLGLIGRMRRRQSD